MINMISSTPNYSTFSESFSDFKIRTAKTPFDSAMKQADELLAKENAKKLVAIIQLDPKFADETAQNYAFSRDLEVVDLADAINQTPEAYEQHIKKFSAQSDTVMNERIQLYQKMKANGSSGAETFKGLMAFNKTLPDDYQKATHIDVMANAAMADSKTSSTVDFTNMTPNEFGELTKSGRFPELPPLVLPKGLDLTKGTNVQMEASLNTKVNYIELIQNQIEFNKSIGESTTYLDNFLNLMKNFSA